MNEIEYSTQSGEMELKKHSICYTYWIEVILPYLIQVGYGIYALGMFLIAIVIMPIAIIYRYYYEKRRKEN